MLFLACLLLFGAVYVLLLEFLPEIRLKRPGNPVWLVISRTAALNRGLKIAGYRRSAGEKLNYAGYRGLGADNFLAIKELAAGSLLAVTALLAGRIGAFQVILAFAGFFLPDLWLEEKVKSRKGRMLNELPYFLDMLALCVEAGLDFGASINRIMQRSAKSPLTGEIGIFQQEIRVGKSREEALHNLSARINIPEVSSFVSSLVQADRMGVSLGQTLRVQSEQIRSARFQRAEKAAHEAPVKMLFPMVLFIFPVIFIVLLGPVALQMLGK